MNFSGNSQNIYNSVGIICAISMLFIVTVFLSMPYLNESALKSQILLANHTGQIFQNLITHQKIKNTNLDKTLSNLVKTQIPDLNRFAAIIGMEYCLSSTPIQYPQKLNSQDLNDKTMYDLFRKVKFGVKSEGESFKLLDVVKDSLRQPVHLTWAAPIISNGKVTGVLKQEFAINHILPQRTFFLICVLVGMTLLLINRFLKVTFQNYINYSLLVVIGLVSLTVLSKNNFQFADQAQKTANKIRSSLHHALQESFETGIDLSDLPDNLNPNSSELKLETKLPFAAKLLPLALALLTFWYFNSGKAKSLMQILAGNYMAYLYIAPAMIGMFLLVAIPLIYGVILAFMQVKQDHWEFVGIDNFIAILSDFHIQDPSNFYFTLGVTVLWTASNVILHVGIGLFLALLLNRSTLKFKKFYRILLILPWAIPNYITALIWKGMFHKQFGAINAVLSFFGFEPISWFNSFWTAFIANITTNVWLGFPFMMVISLGALQSIPGELYEAAAMDGASSYQRFRTITLPLLKSALFPAIILGTIWTFNMFNIIYLVSGGAPEGATDILIVDAYRWAFQKYNYGYAAAYSLVIFVVLFTYSVITNRMTNATEGAFD